MPLHLLCSDKKISFIHSFLSVKSTATLIHATVTLRLDYCNSTLSGVPANQSAPIQRVQNNAARLVLKKRKRDHITPLLKQLHWLLYFRNQYKIGIIAFRHFDNSLLPYFSHSLTIYQSTRTLRYSSENSSENNLEGS